MDFEAVSKWLAGEWAVITHAPVTFVAAVIVIGFLIWKAVAWQFSTQLQNTKSTLALREAQLQDYKDKLSGATPDEARARMDALEARLDQIAPQIAALGPRRVSADKRQAMLPVLDRCRGSHVSIASDAASTDAAQLSKGLVAAFNGAAWNVQTPMILGIGNPPPSGIGLKVGDPAQLTAEEQCVADALSAAELEFDLQSGGATLPIHGEKAVELILTTRLHD